MDDSASLEKRVALVGSSGGGTATLGHTNIGGFVEMISRFLSGIRVHTASVQLVTVLFVSMDDGGGFDGSTGKEQATLLYIRETYQHSIRGTLDAINRRVQTLEKILAKDIREGNIDGLITVSCKPSLFVETFGAVVARSLPVTGTGGSSLSELSSKFSLRVIGNAGGSVATTPETKAISFANAFSREWGLQFDPSSSAFKAYPTPTWRSVLNSCLPAFWGACLLKRLIYTTGIGEWIPNCGEILPLLEAYALPTVCSVIMATSRRETESATMAAILAASSCHKTITGGLLAGYLVSQLEQRALYRCLLRWNLPATMTNLVTSGMVGIVVALAMAPISPYLSMASKLHRDNISLFLWERTDENVGGILRLLLRCSLGCLFCYGSKVGWCKWKCRRLCCGRMILTRAIVLDGIQRPFHISSAHLDRDGTRGRINAWLL